MGNPTGQRGGGGATSPRGEGFQSSRGGSGSTKCSREQPIPFMYPPPKSNTVLPPPDMYYNQEYPAITPQQHLPPPAAPLPPPPAPRSNPVLDSRKRQQDAPSRSEDKSELLPKKSPMKARRDIFVDVGDANEESEDERSSPELQEIGPGSNMLEDISPFAIMGTQNTRKFSIQNFDFW
eukprot:sb/3471758/